jgi:hypothetical protein
MNAHCHNNPVHPLGIRASERGQHHYAGWTDEGQRHATSLVRNWVTHHSVVATFEISKEVFESGIECSHQWSSTVGMFLVEKEVRICSPCVS